MNQNQFDPGANPWSRRRRVPRSPRRADRIDAPKASKGATASATDGVLGRHGFPKTSPDATLTNANALPVLTRVNISAPWNAFCVCGEGVVFSQSFSMRASLPDRERSKDPTPSFSSSKLTVPTTGAQNAAAATPSVSPAPPANGDAANRNTPCFKSDTDTTPLASPTHKNDRSFAMKVSMHVTREL